MMMDVVKEQVGLGCGEVLIGRLAAAAKATVHHPLSTALITALPTDSTYLPNYAVPLTLTQLTTYLLLVAFHPFLLESHLDVFSCLTLRASPTRAVW